MPPAPGWENTCREKPGVQITLCFLSSLPTAPSPLTQSGLRRSSLLLAPATALFTQATILSICPGGVMQPGNGLRGKRHLDPLAGGRNELREHGTRGNERFRKKVLDPQERQMVAGLRVKAREELIPRGVSETLGGAWSLQGRGRRQWPRMWTPVKKLDAGRQDGRRDRRPVLDELPGIQARRWGQRTAGECLGPLAVTWVQGRNGESARPRRPRPHPAC